MLGAPHWWCYHIHSTLGPHVPADLKKKLLDKDMHSEAIPKSNNCPTNSSLDSLAIPGSSYFGIFFFAGCRKLKAEALLGPHYLRAEGSSNHRLLRCFSSHTKTRPQKGAEEYPSGHPQHLCTANGLGCKSTFKPRHAQHSSSLDGKL